MTKLTTQIPGATRGALRLAAVLAALSLSLAGCGDKEGNLVIVSGGGGTPSTEPTPTPQATPQTGPFVLVTWEWSYTDQDGQVVARNRLQGISR